jgi:hypothetical protein
MTLKIVGLLLLFAVAVAQKSCSTGLICTLFPRCPEAQDLAKLYKGTTDASKKKEYQAKLRESR